MNTPYLINFVYQDDHETQELLKADNSIPVFVKIIHNFFQLLISGCLSKSPHNNSQLGDTDGPIAIYLVTGLASNLIF